MSLIQTVKENWVKWNVPSSSTIWCWDETSDQSAGTLVSRDKLRAWYEFFWPLCFHGTWPKGWVLEADSVGWWQMSAHYLPFLVPCALQHIMNSRAFWHYSFSPITPPPTSQLHAYFSFLVMGWTFELDQLNYGRECGKWWGIKQINGQAEKLNARNQEK